MAQDPWAQFNPQPAPSTPIYSPPNPDGAFKVEDQAMQREANARATENARRSDLEWNATHNPDGSLKPKPAELKDPTGEQGKAAGFLRRALDSNDMYQAQDIGARSFVGQKASELAPDVLNTLPSAVGNSPERQVADTAQADFVAATLRYESGAAVPPQEMQAQVRRYFPMPGDGPEVIQAKARLRSNAIDALKLSAGPAADKVYQEWQQTNKNADDQQGDGLTGAVTAERGQAQNDGNTPPGGTPPEGTPPNLDPRFYNPEGAQGIRDLAAQGISLGFSDEAAGVGNALSTIFTGGDALDAYREGRDRERENLRRAQEAHPIVGRAAEFLGGGAAARVAEVPMTLANAIKTGAGISGATGAGYGEGAQGTTIGALAGAGTGGLLGAAGHAVASKLASRASAITPGQTGLVAAGERQGIPIRQPDVIPSLRNKYAGLESSQTAGPRIQSARAADAAAIEQRAQEVTGGQAFDRADTTTIGQNVQRIATRANANAREKAGDLYARADRQAPGFVTTPTQTTAFIDNKIAELRAASPSGYNAEISALEGMRDDLAKTGLSVRTLQAQRETIGGRIGDNIADRTRADRTFTEALKVAQDELHSRLAAEVPEAATSLRRADAKWSQYKDLQKEVTGLFLGKRGDATAETASRNLNSLVNNKGNYSALRRFMATATPEERSDFAATFVQNWGANARGEFSPALFAKNVGNASNRTLDALVGTEGRSALRDLQAIANAKTDAMSRMSPSGNAISGAANGLKTLLMGALGFSAGGPGGAAAGAVSREMLSRWGEQRAAKMLLNPDFTRWLRNAPNTTNPRAIDAYFARLGNIGSVAANDNQVFTSALMQAAKASPGSAAANDKTDAGREPVQ